MYIIIYDNIKYSDFCIFSFNLTFTFLTFCYILLYSIYVIRIPEIDDLINIFKNKMNSKNITTDL